MYLQPRYSVLNATTGSFFEALLDGIIPEIRVRSTLIIIRAIATPTGKNALSEAIPVSAKIITLAGIQMR